MVTTAELLPSVFQLTLLSTFPRQALGRVLGLEEKARHHKILRLGVTYHSAYLKDHPGCPHARQQSWHRLTRGGCGRWLGPALWLWHWLSSADSRGISGSIQKVMMTDWTSRIREREDLGRVLGFWPWESHGRRSQALRAYTSHTSGGAVIYHLGNAAVCGHCTCSSSQGQVVPYSYGMRPSTSKALDQCWQKDTLRICSMRIKGWLTYGVECSPLPHLKFHFKEMILKLDSIITLPL